MKAFMKELTLRTSSKVELVDITREVERIVRESGVRDGICLVYAPHATAAIIANENERGLVEDIMSKIKEEFPEDGRWLHNRIDDNAAAHLASAFLSSSLVMPVKEGRLYRGTWQNVFLVELDGPRSLRKVLVEILGE